MSITSQTAQTQITLTGTGQTITIPWTIYDAAEVKVTSTFAGIDTVLIAGLNFTVANLGSPTNSITLTPGIVAAVITLERNTPLTQPDTFVTNGAFPASTIERDYDRAIGLIQQLKLQVDRAVRIPNTNGVIAPLPLLNRANMVLGFDSSGNPQLITPGVVVTYQINAANDLIVPTVAALRAVGSAVANAAGRIILQGFYAQGDFGPARVGFWDAVSTSTDDNISVYKATSVATGRFKFPVAGVFNAKYAGVKADGVTDDTTAMQNLIASALAGAITGTDSNRVTIELPPGQIKLSGGLAINTSNTCVTFRGQGWRTTEFLISSNFGDVLTLTTCPGSTFEGFAIRHTVEMTSGSSIKVIGGYRVSFRNVSVQEPYIGWNLGGAGIYLDDCFTYGASLFTDVSYKGGSCMLLLPANSGANGIYINNCSFDPSGAPSTQSKFQYAIWIQDCDGLWMNNVHVAGGQLAHMKISPGQVGGLGGLYFSNVWFDYYGQQCVNIGENTGIDTWPITDCSFTNCMFQGASSVGVQVYQNASNGCSFVNCTFEFNPIAMNLYGGADIRVMGSFFYGNASAGSVIVLAGGANTKRVLINGNNFSGAASTIGINVSNNVGPAHVFGNFFSTVTTPVQLGTGTTVYRDALDH